MDDKIIIDRMDAEEFLSMLMDAAMQGDNVTQYWTAVFPFVPAARPVW